MGLFLQCSLALQRASRGQCIAEVFFPQRCAVELESVALNLMEILVHPRHDFLLKVFAGTLDADDPVFQDV